MKDLLVSITPNCVKTCADVQFLRAHYVRFWQLDTIRHAHEKIESILAEQYLAFTPIDSGEFSHRASETQLVSAGTRDECEATTALQTAGCSS
jgi:hypothetical protein